MEQERHKKRRKGAILKELPRLGSQLEDNTQLIYICHVSSICLPLDRSTCLPIETNYEK